MAASVATRAALLGLATLLALQHSPEAGAMHDETPEQFSREEASSSATHPASSDRTPADQKHHVHHKPLLALQHAPGAGATLHGAPEQIRKETSSSSSSARSTSEHPHLVQKRAHRTHHRQQHGGSGETYLNSSFPSTFLHDSNHKAKKLEHPLAAESDEEKPRGKSDASDDEVEDSEEVELVEPGFPTPGGGDADNFDEEGESVDEQLYSSADRNISGSAATPKNNRYLPPDCASCQFREQRRNFSLHAIKEQILQKLGMKHAPNTTGRSIPKIPPLHHLLDIYGMQSDQPGYFRPGVSRYEEEDDYHSKTSMAISVAQTTKLRHDLDILHFRFSERTTRSRVTGATLFVHVPTNRRVRVEVYRVVANASEHESVALMLVANTKLYQQYQHRSGWVEIEVMRLVQDWFKSPRENLGIVIKFEDDLGRHIPFSFSGEGHGSDSKTSSEHNQPFVKVHISDGKKPRIKRTIGLNCDDTSKETRCCKYPLTVDFEEFGWDWIIAPKKYDANYCSGECPYVFMQKYPHTHIVQQANPAGTAGPCCAPRKMSPINMLYFDNEFNIIFGLLPGMVVDRCGCQ